jgi:hypothetical protein
LLSFEPEHRHMKIVRSIIAIPLLTFGIVLIGMPLTVGAEVGEFRVATGVLCIAAAIGISGAKSKGGVVWSFALVLIPLLLLMIFIAVVGAAVYSR